MINGVRLVAAGLAVSLTACSLHYQGLSSAGPVQPQERIYGPPALGQFLCMGIDPETPIYGHPGGGVPIAYTTDVVAFYGEQLGRWVGILMYYGGNGLGWVDGTKLNVYSQTHPGHTCIIPGLDYNLNPIFLIQ